MNDSSNEVMHMSEGPGDEGELSQPVRAKNLV